MAGVTHSEKYSAIQMFAAIHSKKYSSVQMAEVTLLFFHIYILATNLPVWMEMLLLSPKDY